MELLPELAVAKYEMRFFHQLALHWNRQPQSWSLFPDFLALVYSHRIMRQPEEEPNILPFPTSSEPSEQDPQDDSAHRVA